MKERFGHKWSKRIPCVRSTRKVDWKHGRYSENLSYSIGAPMMCFISTLVSAAFSCTFRCKRRTGSTLGNMLRANLHRKFRPFSIVIHCSISYTYMLENLVSRSHFSQIVDSLITHENTSSSSSCIALPYFKRLSFACSIRRRSIVLRHFSHNKPENMAFSGHIDTLCQ